MNILVLDIGRTHIKTCLIDGEGNITRRFETDNRTSTKSGISVFDTDNIWRWFLKTLTKVCQETTVDAISTTTHGASAVFLTENGESMGVLDYESSLYETVSENYNQLRDPYETTCSPSLANGLNLGRQIYWLQQEKPELFRRVTSILTYPQYWSFRLCGVKSTEITSLGTHTDLWDPFGNRYSGLPDRCNWTPLFPPLRNAFDFLGKPLPEICEQTGLNPDCKVLCGIHDSNATFTYHYNPEKPITLLSTGTWVIGMCAGSRTVSLSEGMDELANVNLLNEPLPSFRFMGGREWEILSQGIEETPDVSVVDQIIDKGIFALPAFSSQGGPFRHLKGELIGPPATDVEKKALASLYCAQVTAWCLQRFNSSGSLIVDGPFIHDEIYLSVLNALLPDSDVLATSVSDGTALGAARLAIWPKGFSPQYQLVSHHPIRGLALYHQRWMAMFSPPES